MHVNMAMPLLSDVVCCTSHYYIAMRKHTVFRILQLTRHPVAAEECGAAKLPMPARKCSPIYGHPLRDPIRGCQTTSGIL